MPNPNLPVEILDYVADYLHDTNDALRNCCIISKSWIPRTRKQLFANIKFHVVEDVRSWKKMFPDPSTSPARYTKTLYFGPDVVLAADREVGGWIRGFSLASSTWRWLVSESLIVMMPVNDGYRPEEDEVPIATQPLRPPMFTGSLELYLMHGMEHFTRRLLSLPGGIHFRKLIWTWLYEENLSLMKTLVEGCSHTLESLDIACDLRGMAILHLRLHR
jgi:hypothetical protein